MADVSKLAPLSVAAGDIASLVTNENEDNTNEQEPDSRKTPPRAPSPRPLFTFGKSVARTTWNAHATSEQNYIQLVVEREGFPNGAVIADRLDPHLLFKVAPALQKRLEGRRIYVPSASCLDEETIESMTFGLLRYASEGTPVLEPGEKTPVSMIKMHCILVFLEMKTEARDLEAKLWDVFQQVKLTPMDVLWIWDTFSGRVQSEPYTAPLAFEYVQMMAWQILNLDAVGMLDDAIRHLIELEKEPKYFTETIEARFKTHGLAKVPFAPETKTEALVETCTTKTETPSCTEKDTVDGQKNESEPAIAKQAGQPSTNDETKSRNLVKLTPGIKAPEFKSAGLTDVFKLPPPSPTLFRTPNTSIAKAIPASPNFDFSRASHNIVAYPKSASQNTAQAGVKRSGMFMGNAHGEKRNKMDSKAPKFDATPTESRLPFGGANSSNTFAPKTTSTPPSSASGIGSSVSSQSQFSGFPQPPVSVLTQAPTQPTTSTNTGEFMWGAPGATQAITNAPSQPTAGFGASAGSTFNPFGGASTAYTSTLTPSTQAPVSNVGFNLVRTLDTGFHTPASPQGPSRNTGSNVFGYGAAGSTGPAQGQFPNPGNTFNTPTSNAPFTGTFNTSAQNSSSNAAAFGSPFNNFTQPAPTTPAPGFAGFPVNNNFGGQSFSQPSNGFGGPFQPQHSNGSPVSNPFGNPANNAGAQNNMFAFQGGPGGGAGSAQSGAMGGGMVRRIAKATGSKRRKRGKV